MDPDEPRPSDPAGGPPTQPWTPPADDDLGSLVGPEDGPAPGSNDPTVVQPAAAQPAAAQPPAGGATAAHPVPGSAPGASTADEPKKPNVALRYSVAIFGVIALIGALVGGYYWGQASQQNDKLQSQLDAATTQVDDLTAQVDELNGQVEDLTATNKDLNAQVKDLKSKNKDLQTKNDQLTAQNEQLQPLVGADPTAGPVNVGQALLIAGTNGAQLNVTVAGTVDPDAALTPGEGNRIVGVTVTLVNLGGSEYRDDQFGVGAKLSAGSQVYGPSSGGGSLTSVSLGAGGSTAGTLLFEIPADAALTSFSLTLSGGTGPQSGTWNLS
jgi:hypothetical protein